MKAMKRLLLLSVLGVTAAAQSVTAPVSYRVSDIALYGIDERHAVFYGDSGTIKLGGNTLNLTKASTQSGAKGLQLPSTLRVMGAGSLALPSQNLTALTVFRNSGGLRLITRVPMTSVYYFDGKRWNTMSRTIAGQENVKVTPVPRNSIFGAGLLTNPEAIALGNYLTANKREVVVGTGLSAPNPSPFTPAPQSYRSTALFVQIGVRDATDAAAAAAQVASSVQVLQSGAQSLYEATTLDTRLSSSATEFGAVWQLAAGTQVPAPTAPSVDFAKQKVVTVFMGQKPTGGYGLRLVSSSPRRDGLRLLLEASAPSAGLVQSQVITSPYLMLTVDAGVKSVEVEVINPKP